MKDTRKNLKVCEICGHESSGPNAKSVAESAVRHASKKHPKKEWKR
jgi:cation transport regulator ChaB